MSTVFVISYGILCCIVLLESFVLREALRKTIWFKRFYSALESRVSRGLLQSGDFAPQFSAVSADFKVIRTSDLSGASSALIFVSPETAESPMYVGFASFIHSMWHKTTGHLYLVCHSAHGSCVKFVSDQVEGFPLDKVLVDADGAIARGFRIKTMPHAVELDDEVRVKRYGKPEIVTDNKRSAGRGATQESRQWLRRDITGSGYTRVDTSVSCMLTRFRLQSVFSLLSFYFAFRRVRAASRNIDGLIQALFLVEDFHTCYTLSLWKDDFAILDFGGVREHVDAANSALHSTYRKDLNRLEIWSAQFRLWGVSDHNLSWQGVDLTDAIRKRDTAVAKTSNLT